MIDTITYYGIIKRKGNKLQCQECNHVAKYSPLKAFNGESKCIKCKSYDLDLPKNPNVKWLSVSELQRNES